MPSQTCSLLVDIIKNTIGFCFTIPNLEVFADPGHKVIFKNTFDNLVKKVRCQHPIDVSIREIICEWLYEVTLDYLGRWVTKPTKKHTVEQTNDEHSSGWTERSTTSRGKPKKLEQWYKSEINWGIPTTTGGIYTG